MDKIQNFSKNLKTRGVSITRTLPEILQINLGKFCNQACHHCHVEAGPNRTERMERKTILRILELLADCASIHTIDLTGGAPELNENFQFLVGEVHRMGKRILDRCNLTVLTIPGQEDTGSFLKNHQVEIVASLPCYSSENVDQQRGSGVFKKSIEALRGLNRLGYGKAGTGLILNLVYNPLGPFLPPEQKALEADYKRELRERFGISFNHLFSLINMPIKRFLDDLYRQGAYESYLSLLVNNFSSQATQAVMCRDLLSVGWDGELFDCDFNQMLEIPLGVNRKTLWDINFLEEVVEIPINLGNHCYGCTAGAGSSCGGSLI